MRMRLGGFMLAGAALLVGGACLGVDVQDDSEPPTVRILTPENGATVSGQVPINIEALDDTGIILVRLYRNNVLITQTQNAPYNFIWDTGGFADGEYKLSAEAVDLVQNRAVAEVTVTLANSGKFQAPPGN